MFQLIIIGLLFAAAAFYIFNLLRKNFSLKQSGCPKGCGCSKIDLDKIEAAIKKNDLLKQTE